MSTSLATSTSLSSPVTAYRLSITSSRLPFRRREDPDPDVQLWFAKTEHLIANHIVIPDPGPEWYPEVDWYDDELEGRTVLVRNARPLTIEAIVRGYLAGSGWKEYQRREGMRHPAAPGPEGVRQTAGADLHSVDKSRIRARRERILRGSRALVGPGSGRASAWTSLAL